MEFPDGARWLVDAGGLPGSVTFDIGERVVAPSLWARGTGRLDALVLTHGDPDHIGGAAAVIDDFAPSIFDGVPVPIARAASGAAGPRAGPASHVGTTHTGRALAIGGAHVRVWHPPPPDWERQRVRNDDSVVIEVRYGDVSIVLPGDISAEVERALAAEIPPARHRVLKAAHHGSATSTSDVWLDALRPEVVVFSCGRENRYGHPAPAVLRRVLERGAKVFRTDEDGQVVVETDGKALSVHTFTGTAYAHDDYHNHEGTMTRWHEGTMEGWTYALSSCRASSHDDEELVVHEVIALCARGPSRTRPRVPRELLPEGDVYRASERARSRSRPRRPSRCRTEGSYSEPTESTSWFRGW